MRIYAFDLAGGRQLWRSEKLSGVSFRGYHPVVAPDGSVMVTVTPALSLDSFNPILLDMVKEIFGDFASWRYTKEENVRLCRRTSFTEDEWKKVRQLPWDWDTCEMPRLNHLLQGLPGKISGTRQQPLMSQADDLVSRVTDNQLDRFIWETPTVEFADMRNDAILKKEPSRSVIELISKDWRPLVFPPGKHPRESYRFFTEPAETLLTLARAYEYLDSILQQEIRQYIARMSRPGSALDGLIGRRTYEPNAGEIRSLYDIPTERLFV